MTIHNVVSQASWIALMVGCLAQCPAQASQASGAAPIAPWAEATKLLACGGGGSGSYRKPARPGPHHESPPQAPTKPTPSPEAKP